MTATRTSNKQILEAIERQSAGIEALVNVLSQNNSAAPAPKQATPPVLTETVERKPERAIDQTEVNVPASYKQHMAEKIQDKANETGNTYVEYARKNLSGETKLAYCLADRWPSLKDRGLIGAVAIIKPSS